METKNLTHRLYIDEYNAEFVRQIINGQIDGIFCTDESTDKILVITGSLENLTKISSLMYRDEADIKAAFPSFITQEEFNGFWLKAMRKSYEFIRDEMFFTIEKTHKTGYQLPGEWTKLHDVYVDLKMALNEKK